jgi:DNA-binding MarR family transcriptional regulator
MSDHSDPHFDELLDTLLLRGQELGHLLLSRRLAGGLYRRVAGGIPPVQLQALAALAGGDVRMRELARRLGLATSTVTRLVDRLEAAGLAERRSERPDRRSILVGLTARGDQALASVRGRLGAVLRELLAGLTATEQAELLRLLAKVGESLGPRAAPAPA